MRVSKEDRKKKLDKFIEVYLETSNGSEAARQAGWAVNRAAQTSTELLKDPYVKEKLSTYQNLDKDIQTDALGTLDDIFDTVASQALNALAKEAKTDSDAAKKFLELKLKYDSRKTEVLGDYEGLSTKELIGQFDTLVEEGQALKERIVEALRAGEM